MKGLLDFKDYRVYLLVWRNDRKDLTGEKLAIYTEKRFRVLVFFLLLFNFFFFLIFQ